MRALKLVALFPILLLLNLTSGCMSLQSNPKTMNQNRDQNETLGALTEMKKRVITHTLSNGIRVIIYPRGQVAVFAGMLAVRVGGVDERKGHTGLSHLLEHLAFKGSKRIGTKDYFREEALLREQDELREKEEDLSELELLQLKEIEKELESLVVQEEFSELYTNRGASGLNATTSKELTSYFVSLPRPAFEFWCAMEAERLINPVFRQFYQERDVVMEERRMRSEDDPFGKLYEALLSRAFVSHPYRDPVIGYESDIKSMTRSQVVAFHQLHYVPKNIAISLVGEVSEKDLETLERYFGDIGKSKDSPLKKAPLSPNAEAAFREFSEIAMSKLPIEPKQDVEREVVVKHPSSPYLTVAYHKPTYPDREDAHINLLAEVLAGSVISPLYQRMVKDLQVVTSISAFEAPGNKYPNLMIFGMVPRHPHTSKEVLKIFDEELKKLLDTGFTEEQLTISKRRIAVNYLSEFKSNISLARQFASAALLYDDWQAPFTWFENVLNTSREEIQAIGKELLITSNRTVAAVEPK
jgi:predicted Zn-dependent peptidase